MTPTPWYGVCITCNLLIHDCKAQRLMKEHSQTVVAVACKRITHVFDAFVSVYLDCIAARARA